VGDLIIAVWVRNTICYRCVVQGAARHFQGTLSARNSQSSVAR
jgi:hypothetical protein